MRQPHDSAPTPPSSRFAAHRLALPVLAGLLAVSGCGQEATGVRAADSDLPSSSTTTAQPVSESSVPRTTLVEPVTTAGVEPSATTLVEPVTTTAGPGPSDTELPGEAIDGIPPEAGAEVAVVGVAAGDGLNLRTRPGASEPILHTLDPTATGLTATGASRLVGDAIWTEIDTTAGTGWVNSSFVGHLTESTDITADLLADLGADPAAPPSAETMDQLVAVVFPGLIDGGALMVKSESAADSTEVVFDQLGFEDDSALGLRLAFFATPLEVSEGWELVRVERTELCSRGASGGLCI